MDNNKREQLAALSHDIWSHWMKWQFSVCEWPDEAEKSGDMIIPASRVDRWTRQMKTPYSELSEQEKESDRHQADKILVLLDEECGTCGQRDFGQTGEVPCKACGLPTVWDNEATR